MTITPSMRYLLLYGGYSVEHFQDSKISPPYDQHIAEETSGRGILYEPSSKVQMIHLADLHGDEDITVTVLPTPDNISTTEAAKGVILIGNSCASDHENLYIYGGFELSHREYSGRHKSAKKRGKKAIQSKSGETINRRLSKLEELGEDFIAVVNEYGNQIQYINNANVTFTYDVNNQIWIYPPNPSQEEMSTKQLLGRILNELAAISQRHKREGKGSAETENILRHSAHGLTVPFKNHQAFGVQWLMYTEAIHKGALLANSMGLGKTLQILSLILETPEQRPNLIVVTLGILLNWVIEIKTKTRISDEELHVFHGKFRAIKKTDMETKKIVLTTYHTLCVEARNPDLPIWNVKFGQIVANEADTLKNYKGGSLNAVSKIDGESLILVTATPFQNEIMDLYSYFTLFNLWKGILKDFH
ncbi:hypothetical protein K493DRAFT_309738 [Basidiobolus meristosporus CBS 931.73]|uniref:Helicase ATP-binding domain-containing protein n=1 Tax=Basidiobolus meristosporus CBS 931.73 TaxID=1314790 RepID=A0A1Y1VQD0_9FUNG|nr:hypothetical protein K493DRAFT_309738 [Basidiobolus meristosporus CBS 931.73]|eukprot:ORX63497.1 hypothetical protein K493DRAFT_309738 [Basidiobolus meristosporus CBS 931.73]